MSATLALSTLLKEGSREWQKEAKAMPQFVLQDQLNYVKAYTAIHGELVLPTIKSAAKFVPHSSSKGDTNTTSIEARTLTTKQCDVVEEYDPADLYLTCWGRPVEEDALNTEVAHKIAMEASRSACAGFVHAMWSGAYNSAGTDTDACCDGFDTIIAAEKTAATPTISATIGNYMQAGQITENNAVQRLMAVYGRANKNLKAQPKLYMYVPMDVKELYEMDLNDNYRTQVNVDDYNQTYLLGTNKRVEIVALPGMEDMTHIILAVPENLSVGFDGRVNSTEEFEMRRPDNPKLIQMYQTVFFGVQIYSLDPRVFMCASFTTKDLAVYAETDVESVDFGTKSTTATATVTFKGYNLTAATSVSITGTHMSVGAASISAASANGDDGATITITFAAQADDNVSGVLTIDNPTDGIHFEIPVTGKYGA